MKTFFLLDRRQRGIYRSVCGKMAEVGKDAVQLKGKERVGYTAAARLLRFFINGINRLTKAYYKE